MLRRAKPCVSRVLVYGLLALTLALTPGCRFGSALSVSYDPGTRLLDVSVNGDLLGLCVLVDPIPPFVYLCTTFDQSNSVKSIFLASGLSVAAGLTLLDPLVVQFPAGASNFSGTFLNVNTTDTGSLVITSGLTSIAIDATQTLMAEPGMQIVVFDLPGSAGTAGDFVFNMSATMPVGPTSVQVKPIITGRLDLGGQTFYPPVLPCVTDFASVPALNIPLQNGAVPLSLTGLQGCNNNTYNFGAATPIPTLSQWGMILLSLSLLTIATWQLAGRPVLFAAGTSGPVALYPPRRQWLTSLLLGQGIATLGLVMYAVVVGPLVPHDGLGAFLAGVLLGVMVKCYRHSRSL